MTTAAGVIVDLKTGRSGPPTRTWTAIPQLGVYQLAVLLGGSSGSA